MNRKLILYLSIVVASGALFINVYNSVVDAASWGHNIPESIYTARKYYEVTTPATFLRVFSPLNQILGLLAAILFWKSSRAIRLLLVTALAFYIATDALTFGYFYPRIAIMFEGSLDTTSLTQAWREWSDMNWVRSFILATGVFLSSTALHKVYKQPN